MLNAIAKARIDAYRRREPPNVSTEDENSRWVGAGGCPMIDSGRYWMPCTGCRIT